jgi:hypothetical protein
MHTKYISFETVGAPTVLRFLVMFPYFHANTGETDRNSPRLHPQPSFLIQCTQSSCRCNLHRRRSVITKLTNQQTSKLTIGLDYELLLLAILITYYLHLYFPTFIL